MELEARLKGIRQLGFWFNEQKGESLDALCQIAANQNNWFTKESIEKCFNAWAEALQKDKMQDWVKPYSFKASGKNIGLVLAGNIPLVGLHDVLSVIISGNVACVKYSSQDSILMKAVINALINIDAGFKELIQEVERLNDVDAVIATGSDNSARYFKHYFAGKPHIIRQNRVSVGIVNGSESTEDFEALGEDIFTYFGLGCRNVSKVYVPKDFKLPTLISAMDKFSSALDHHKYRNNYDYNKSIYLVNKEPHLDSGFFMMRESKELVSPISVLYYETYESEAELSLKLSAQQDKIQCVVSKDGWYEGSLPFGTAQCPELWDYADGVDTLEFLASL
ncbi:acyl-CoA reductase [Roseivirga spongicola]|uniref:Acyl-CoA reductase n=1 Tax=Roseivirga spongicola TaxID=333140 RepID=A0A150X5G4_9BACT|nr:MULTISPECIES: acyl-CoA reductase [Roseivirga]KYG73946.1 acyl-CoA reductase [Roseivirga spongicola]MBO6660248.1 acyl-CoA reductase [Roseivirga sp.]MBO6762549.1 acyl-CoA reductase [Roseivirga sp.]MBO6907015.1 acyl-CoA reductase [Roseivirga sp.]